MKKILVFFFLIIGAFTYIPGLYQSILAATRETSNNRLSTETQYELNSNSFFGNYEYYDETGNFTINNPSHPSFNHKLGMAISATPINDFEFFLNPSLEGIWGSSDNNLFFDEVYAKYYGAKAALTMGYFKKNLGPAGLLYSADLKMTHPGFVYETMFWNTWVTVIYNRLEQSLVDSKVVSDFLLDDLVACRLSKKFGNSLVGLNLLTDGFYDEKGLTLDWDGTIGNRHITMEAGAYYPDALTRGPLIKTVEEPDPADSTHTITREVEIPSCYKDQIYYGAFLSFDLFKTRRQALTLRTGYFELGFRPEYSSLKEYSDPFKDMVKASGDTVSANLYYTRK
jgi:hypothetical protein